MFPRRSQSIWKVKQPYIFCPISASGFLYYFTPANEKACLTLRQPMRKPAWLSASQWESLLDFTPANDKACLTLRQPMRKPAWLYASQWESLLAGERSGGGPGGGHGLHAACPGQHCGDRLPHLPPPLRYLLQVRRASWLPIGQQPGYCGKRAFLLAPSIG